MKAVSFFTSTVRFPLVSALIPTLALVLSELGGHADTLFVSYGDRRGLSRPNTIEKFDSITGADLGIFASANLSLPWGLALDQTGNLYVANYGNNTIYKFTPDGVGSLFAQTATGPRALVFDATGNLYVANYWAGNIQKFTPDGVGSLFASNLQFPTGLTIDNAGNLYEADGGTRTINKFTPAGAQSLFANPGEFSSPLDGLACDAAGNIYLGCQAGNSGGIMKFTPGGNGTIFTQVGATATGMVFDNTGMLYGAFYGNNTITKVSPNGQYSVLAATQWSPAGIALQAIPEPSPTALLALGLPLVLIAYSRTVRPV